MLSILERRQPKYCFFGRVMQTTLLHTEEYLTTSMNELQALDNTCLLNRQFIKCMSVVFPLSVSSIYPPSSLKCFWIGFDFQHFVRSSTLFVSSFAQFYIWLCANLFTLAVPFILFVMCGQRHCIPLQLEEQWEETYSCDLRYATITSHFWIGFIFLNFRHLQYRCHHLRYSSLLIFMVYEKK